jgi:hypothetical protein
MPVLLRAITQDEWSGRFINVCLINNMPDETLKATNANAGLRRCNCRR